MGILEDWCLITHPWDFDTPATRADSTIGIPDRRHSQYFATTSAFTGTGLTPHHFSLVCCDHPFFKPPSRSNPEWTQTLIITAISRVKRPIGPPAAELDEMSWRTTWDSVANVTRPNDDDPGGPTEVTLSGAVIALLRRPEANGLG